MADDGHVHAEIAKGDEQVKVDAIRIGQYTDGQFPTDSKEFAKRIFYTVYMGTENRWVRNTESLSLVLSYHPADIVLLTLTCGKLRADHFKSRVYWLKVFVF